MKTTIKYISYISFVLISFISLFPSSYAEEWYIENLLDIQTWPEIYKINTILMDEYYFKDKLIKNIYSKMKQADKLLKQAIIFQYKANKLDYYKTNAIINNYDYFIDSVNDFFDTLYMVDQNNSLKNEKEIQETILKAYEDMRTHYNRVKYLLNN